MSCDSVGIFRKSKGQNPTKKATNVLQPRLIKDELVLVFIPYYPY